jgi:asparagine synthase (glutamine-hydrolysing)
MCGIAGIWGSIDDDAIRTMMERMVHRGPDADGLFAAPADRGVLGHRRLSIMDPQGGRQPILGTADDRALVANGEIYNFRRLNDQLTRRDALRTRSDSETILRLFEEQEQAAVEQLDGMFAFVIADGEHVFAARDPIGIKPLYIGRSDDSWCFASEQKALVGFADEVEEFPPGSFFHSARGWTRYYDVPEQDWRDPTSGPDEAAREIRTTLEAAIGKRLMSDVPLGAFLSGGLDSSVIAAIARQQMDELHTFSVGFEGSRDLEAARLVSRHLDTIHHEYVLTEDEMMRHLPKILYHLESYDQDLVRSAMPTYFTARLAAEHVKVVLTGEGADELFAGYRYHREITDPGALHRELRRSITALHNCNLQRVDRLTMAHSIEARVPFLDADMIAMSQHIPPQLKLRRMPDGQLVEKWILRKAVEDLLPHEIVWRDKEQFDEGSGTVELVNRRGLSGWLPPNAADRYTARFPEAGLRSYEECVYHKILREAYSDPGFILGNVGRWAERPVASGLEPIDAGDGVAV